MLIAVYAFIMAAVNLILIVQSIQEFITHKGDDVNKFHLPSIIAVGVAFGRSKIVLTINPAERSGQTWSIPILLQHSDEKLASPGTMGGSSERSSHVRAAVSSSYANQQEQLWYFDLCRRLEVEVVGK